MSPCLSRGARAALRRCATLALLLSPGFAVHTAPQFMRDLPLNRFPASRQAQTDSHGFYRMRTAIEDDYFDGTSPLERVKRHFATARRLGASYFRCGFTWNAIEKQPGKYDWSFWDHLVVASE